MINSKTPSLDTLKNATEDELEAFLDTAEFSNVPLAELKVFNETCLDFAEHLPPHLNGKWMSMADDLRRTIDTFSSSPNPSGFMNEVLIAKLDMAVKKMLKEQDIPPIMEGDTNLLSEYKKEVTKLTRTCAYFVQRMENADYILNRKDAVLNIAANILPSIYAKCYGVEGVIPRVDETHPSERALVKVSVRLASLLLEEVDQTFAKQTPSTP